MNRREGGCAWCVISRRVKDLRRARARLSMGDERVVSYENVAYSLVVPNSRSLVSNAGPSIVASHRITRR